MRNSYQQHAMRRRATPSRRPAPRVRASRVRPMLSRMQRGGLLRQCDCRNACGCEAQALRLLQIAASRGRFAGLHQPDINGDRYRVYRYPVRGRWLSVVTDNAYEPEVVDVAVMVPGDRMDTEDLDEGELGSIPASSHLKPGWISVSKWSALPAQGGVYHLSWPGGSYIGKATNLRDRVGSHFTSAERLGFDTKRHKISYAFTEDGSSPRDAEKDILTKLAARGRRKRLEAGARKVGIVDSFKALGMTNRQREWELEGEGEYEYGSPEWS